MNEAREWILKYRNERGFRDTLDRIEKEVIEKFRIKRLAIVLNVPVTDILTMSVKDRNTNYYLFL